MKLNILKRKISSLREMVPGVSRSAYHGFDETEYMKLELEGADIYRTAEPEEDFMCKSEFEPEIPSVTMKQTPVTENGEAYKPTPVRGSDVESDQIDGAGPDASAQPEPPIELPIDNIRTDGQSGDSIIVSDIMIPTGFLVDEPARQDDVPMGGVASSEKGKEAVGEPRAESAPKTIGDVNAEKVPEKAPEAIGEPRAENAPEIPEAVEPPTGTEVVVTTELPGKVEAESIGKLPETTDVVEKEPGTHAEAAAHVVPEGNAGAGATVVPESIEAEIVGRAPETELQDAVVTSGLPESIEAPDAEGKAAVEDGSASSEPDSENFAPTITEVGDAEGEYFEVPADPVTIVMNANHSGSPEDPGAGAGEGVASVAMTLGTISSVDGAGASPDVATSMGGSASDKVALDLKESELKGHVEELPDTTDGSALGSFTETADVPINVPETRQVPTTTVPQDKYSALSDPTPSSTRRHVNSGGGKPKGLGASPRKKVEVPRGHTETKEEVKEEVAGGKLSNIVRKTLPKPISADFEEELEPAPVEVEDDVGGIMRLTVPELVAEEFGREEFVDLPDDGIEECIYADAEAQGCQVVFSFGGDGYGDEGVTFNFGCY